jgi:hypothetical protein
MTEFVLPVGATLPVLNDVLRDADGAPISLTGATVDLILTSLTTPYAVIPVTGTAAVVSPTSAGTVRFTPADADTAAPVAAAITWRVTVAGDERLVPGAFSVFRVQAVEDVPPTVPVCSPADIETAIRRALTEAEWASAVRMIAEVTDVVERWCVRDFRPKRRTERHIVPVTGRVFCDYGPVQQMVSITVNDGEPSTAWNDDYDVTVFNPGDILTLVYDSGHTECPDAVKGVITQAVAAPIVAGVQAGTGAVTSYSVEGTSITYGGSATGDGAGAVGRFTAASLNSIRSLRRGVVAW